MLKRTAEGARDDVGAVGEEVVALGARERLVLRLAGDHLEVVHRLHRHGAHLRCSV